MQKSEEKVFIQCSLLVGALEISCIPEGPNSCQVALGQTSYELSFVDINNHFLLKGPES